MAPKTTSKPSDFTGRQREILTEAAQAELAEREGQIALAQATERERLETEVIDTTVVSPTPVILDSVEAVEVNLADDSVIIRVVEDIEDMTFGAGNLLTFKVGQRYKVSNDLANHLEEKGYIYSR